MSSFLDFFGADQPRHDRGIRFGDAQAERMSYAQLWIRAAQTWPELERCRSGDVVLLVGENTPTLVDALLACWWRGLVPCCVAPPARLSPGAVFAHSLAGWAQASGAVLGLCEGDLLPRCQSQSLPWGWGSLEGVRGPQQVPRNEDSARVYLQFSSGTTSAPKPVYLTRDNLVHNVEAILKACARRGPLEKHSCVSWLPLYHDMGLVGSLLSALAAQGDLVLMKPYQFAARPHQWLVALSQSRATISPAPNFALSACLERVTEAQLQGLDLSHWQLALLGSETIQPSTVRAFYEKFRPYGLAWESLTPVYGLAEATLAVTFSPPGRGPRFLQHQGRELVSLGPPLEGIELKIEPKIEPLMEPTDEPTGDPEIESGLGSIWTRSPSATVEPGQWLDTGDLGFLSQGELFLTGRSKDIVIVRGRNYDAQAIEECLAGLDGLDPSRAAALGVEDLAVVLVAELPRKQSGTPSLAEAAKRAVAEGMGLVVQVFLVESGWLPRTTSGKVRRAQVLSKLRESGLIEGSDGRP